MVRFTSALAGLFPVRPCALARHTFVFICLQEQKNAFSTIGSYHQTNQIHLSGDKPFWRHAFLETLIGFVQSAARPQQIKKTYYEHFFTFSWEYVKDALFF